MRAYRLSPVGPGYQRVVIVSGPERFGAAVARLAIEVAAWIFCGWAGLPYPEKLKR